MMEACCEQPLHYAGHVDCKFTPVDIRLRHIPGVICLACKSVWAPNVTATPELSADIKGCIEGTQAHLTVLKAIPRFLDEEEEAKEEGFKPVLLDVALGQNAGLVVQEIKGFWNYEVSEAIIPDDALELRSRLMEFAGQEEVDFAGELIPSLVYDTPGHPLSVQMEVTTRCNLTCAYCTHSELEDKADLSTEELYQYFDQIDFSRVQNVDFTGLGEPVLHPQLAEIVQEIQERGTPADIRVVTNGTAFSASRMRKLCDAGVTSIAFSIDSLDPARFARSRGGAKLSKAMKNLHALVEYKEEKKLSDLRIKIKSVLIDDPYLDAEPLLIESARLGLEMPHFSCLDSRSEVQDHYDESWLVDTWSNDEGLDFAKWAEEKWAELRKPADQVQVAAPTETPNHNPEFLHPMLRPSSALCRWAVDATFVSSSGGMMPCCEQMIDLPRKYHGTLRERSLEELWKDELLWSYRLPLSLGVTPEGCKGCAWAPVEESEPLSASNS